MSNIIWLGALLLFDTCLTQPQSPSALITSGASPMNVLSLNINTKKYVHTVGDHFLSITLEPSAIFSALQKNPGVATINMAKGLNPAYIRISGPECNYFKFKGALETPQESSNHWVKRGKNNVTITGWHWSQLNEFLTKTGLDLIVGLNVMNRQQGAWDLSNAVDLISYSDKHGYNMAFQLGNDVQTIGSRIDGLSLGKDATRLRKVLEAFPRYANSAIIGPDTKSCDTQEEARYLKNFIVESGPSLSAVTYQVPFASEKNVENPAEIFSYVQNQLESRVWQKDVLNKYLGKISVKKPLWIVESGNKDRKGDFTDGLIWAQRLCAGARVGINTIMRKPSLLSLSEPTPDYWVSVLHKALIGQEVLDIKISSGNKTKLETVAHCTTLSPYDPNEGILAPEYRYNRGAITVFGVNMGSEIVKILLKTGEKQSLPMHQYFLTGNNRQNGKRATRSTSTLLNGQKLSLSDDGELPVLSPKVRGSHQVITIPSQCIFFLVLPESKSKACMAVQIEESKDIYKNGGKLNDQEEFEVTDYDTPILDQEDELASNEKNTYVAFRQKNKKLNDESITQRNEEQRGTKAFQQNNKMVQTINDESQGSENVQQPESVVKYVTFSNNNWLSKFPKTLKNQEYSEEPMSSFVETTTEVATEKNILPPQSRREKYHILAQAVAGKRYPEKTIRPNLNSNLDSSVVSHRPLQKFKLVKRSISNDFNPKEVEDRLEEFTNKEKPPNSVHLETAETSSTPPFQLFEDHNISERSKIEAIPINPAIPEINQPSVNSQTTQTVVTTHSTPKMSSPATLEPHAKIESHIQKIKTRSECALAKVNERNTQRVNGKKVHKFKSEVIKPTVQGSMIENSPILSKKESKTAETLTSLSEKIRYNRQTNSTPIDENLKIIRPRLSLKLKKPDTNTNIENAKDTNMFTVTEKSHLEPNGVTEITPDKTTKNIKLTPKTFKLTKPKFIKIEPKKNNEKLTPHENIHDTTPQLFPKINTMPVLQPLGKVKTPPDVDVEQIVTNEKVTEKLVENFFDGKKTLQSEQIVSPIDKNGEDKLETKTSITSAAARIKALEEKMKIRRSEMERRFQERLHKVNKRSATNSLIEDDIMDIKDVPDRFGSNELDVDVVPEPKRPVIRHPRSVADFTVKLNEVNTYVDKTKRPTATDPMNNEILEDNFSIGSKDWRDTNDIRISAEDTGEETVSIKSKRKSVFEELDEDDYGKMTTSMINKLLSHMQKFWKYIKKTFLY